MASHPIYQFYAELEDYKPKIWRRFQVTDYITVARLGYIVQVLFEMKASHLMAIEVPEGENRRNALMYLLTPKSPIFYEYSNWKFPQLPTSGACCFAWFSAGPCSFFLFCLGDFSFAIDGGFFAWHLHQHRNCDCSEERIPVCLWDPIITISKIKTPLVYWASGAFVFKYLLFTQLNRYIHKIGEVIFF